MKSIIVGTAGHIDHGKTALVKALTGIDADRLEEEKRRGITIDLGFAHMELPSANGETLRIGFVDVPGHERFVRNMLAGVGGIDLVLLVIAADESIMPQTREHFDILQLLGVRRGITVLTKADAVDAETLEVVRMEVQEFLRGTFLDATSLDRPSPIVAVSALTGAGLNELKRAMVAVAAEAAARDSKALARLPIDRVFTMKGFGTVVTGTLVAGTIRPEDELEVLPGERRVRVRGVQVHGEAAHAAVAGQRTALNVAGASTGDLARGMTLAPAGALRTTRVVDVKLRMLGSAPRALKNRARVHFHSYTMETVGEVLLYDGKGSDAYVAESPTLAARNAARMGHPQSGKTGHTGLPPGTEGFARIRLAEAALLLPGDRFIIRQFSPVVTIGGGTVLDAAPVKRAAGLENYLSLLAGAEVEKILEARIARRRESGISMAALIAETGNTRAMLEKLLDGMLRQGKIERIGDILVHTVAMEDLKLGLISAVEQFHKQNPLVSGISREQLREQRSGPVEIFAAALETLVRNKKIEVAGDLVRLPGHGVVMKDEETESKKRIEEAFATAGLQVPALHEVIGRLKIDKTRAQKIVTLLLRERVLVKISDELVFHGMALQQLRRDLAAYKAKSAKIDVAKFKELTGVSRKYAIPLLEYLDRERVTRRVGDVREIL